MIKEGELVFFHFFDIGGELEIKGLEGRLSGYGRAILEQLPGAPWIEDGIRIAFGEKAEVLGESCNIEGKVFPIGALLIKVTIPVKGKDFQQSLEMVAKAEEEVIRQGVSVSMNEFCRTLAQRLKDDLRPLIKSPYQTIDYSERYRAIVAKDMEKDVLEKSQREIAGLIRKEAFERLSKPEIEEIMNNRYSYRDNVLVCDGRGAFAIVKNSETFPVIRAIELYLLQKLELRIYDSLLDDMLERSYDILEKAESKADKALGENINDIHLMRLELLEIVSGMRSGKGNPKAKVFDSLCAAMGEEFEVEDLVDSVSRKLDKLGEIYTMVYDSLQTTRSIKMEKTTVFLEVIIVVLIVLEIALFLLGIG